MNSNKLIENKLILYLHKKLKYLIKITDKKKLQKQSDPISYLLFQLSSHWPGDQGTKEAIFEELKFLTSPYEIIEKLEESLHKNFFILLQKFPTEEASTKQLQMINNLTSNMQKLIQQIELFKEEMTYTLPPLQIHSSSIKKEYQKIEHEMQVSWKNLINNPPKIWKSTDALNKRIIEIHDFTIMLSYTLKTLTEKSKIELLEDELQTGSIAIQTEPLYIHTFHTPVQQTLINIYKENYPKWIKNLIFQLYEKCCSHSEDSSFFKKQMKILDKDLYQLSLLTNTLTPLINTLEEALFDQDTHQAIQSLYSRLNSLYAQIDQLHQKQTHYTPAELNPLTEKIKNGIYSLLQEIQELHPILHKTVAYKEDRYKTLASYDLHSSTLKQNAEELLRKVQNFQEIYHYSCNTLNLVEKFDQELLSPEEKYQLMLSLKRLLHKGTSLASFIGKLKEKTTNIETASQLAIKKLTPEVESLLKRHSLLHKHLLLIYDHLQEGHENLKIELKQQLKQIELLSHTLIREIMLNFLSTSQWVISPEKWSNYQKTFSCHNKYDYKKIILKAFESLINSKKSKEIASFIHNFQELCRKIPRFHIPKIKLGIFKTKWGKLYKIGEKLKKTYTDIN